MQLTQPQHEPLNGVECEHAACAAPATEIVESEERGAMYYCACHAAEKALAPVHSARVR